MTKLLPILLAMLGAVAHADCRLNEPVELGESPLIRDTPISLNGPGGDRIFRKFKNVKLDRMPRGDAFINRAENGKLSLLINQLYTSASWQGPFIPTGYFGARLNTMPERGLGYGFADTYTGNLSLSGRQMQKNGEQVFTTEYVYFDKYTEKLTLKMDGDKITSIEFVMPVTITKGDVRRTTDQVDTICVLSMEPVAE